MFKNFAKSARNLEGYVHQLSVIQNEVEDIS